VKLELRAMTNTHGKTRNRGRDLLDDTSTKYSWSGSPVMFWNGRTASDGLSGNGNGALMGAVAASGMQ
jgi:hypothetical protein